jgi:O-antigen ligase
LRQWKFATALAVLALAFLGDIFFVTTGRTALVVMPVLVLLSGFRHSGWKGIFAAGLAGCIIAAVVWSISPYVRERVMGIYSETVLYETTTEATSSGIRISFWKQSLHFIKSAPLLGHGTGSIGYLFDHDAGDSGFISDNPHNQTFAVGIQLGFLGMVVLWAMWISHLLLFRGPGLLSWIGLVIVTSNIVGSLFNSFIFDFTEGWLYVIGVGVIAGMVQRTARVS